MNNIEELITKAYELGLNKYGANIFTKEGFIELAMAERLGHKWNSDMRNGADAYDEDGTPVEYKSTQGFKGIQFCGLNQDGIDKFKDHKYLYHAIKDGVKIVEIIEYKMSDIIIEMQRLFDIRDNKDKFQCTIGVTYLNELRNK